MSIEKSLNAGPEILKNNDDNFLGNMLNKLFKKSDQEMNKNLSPNTINDDSLKIIDKLLPGLGEIITGLAIIPSFFGLKGLIEEMKKQTIKKTKNNFANNIHSNPSYQSNEYIGPYSLDHYEQMKTAQKLGSEVVGNPFVVKPGKTGYCGAGVRGILTNYMGFSGFPSYGADGKKRDTILEKDNITDKTGKKVTFQKVKVKTPYDAKSGAVIPYEGNAELGSSNRKNDGHVEIKGADGKYYSDSTGSQPGGSARVSLAEANIMSAEEYKKQTGFQGYVYYPVIEGEINQVA